MLSSKKIKLIGINRIPDPTYNSGSGSDTMAVPTYVPFNLSYELLLLQDTVDDVQDWF
jgi:hypothetical protein